MKRLFGFLAKPELRKDENFYSFDDVSDIDEKNVYRYYRFDSDELDRGIPLSRRTDKSRKSSAKPSNSRVFTSSPTDDDELEKDCACVENNPDSKSLDLSESASPVTVLDNLPSFQQNSDSAKDDNCRKNTFVININHGKYFHIGSQKTININENPSTVQNPPRLSSRSSRLETDLQKLSDCEEKLSDVHISLISLHVNDRWRDFVRNLGLEEPFLEVLELRNDHNRILTVYDALQKLVTRYPNTSIGFLVRLLLEVQNERVVEKLALELTAD